MVLVGPLATDSHLGRPSSLQHIVTTPLRQLLGLLRDSEEPELFLWVHHKDGFSVSLDEISYIGITSHSVREVARLYTEEWMKIGMLA
jgi:hypothetical protein